ncbi:hypothetical protein DL93DRAFT_2103312 [Clavulina sp. PMI_390]|nr:hypothetical protein DL93DRAFT_2103312 [Clavulina sp. PMI_390]
MPAVRSSRPRPRPRPRFDKLAEYQYPCPYEQFDEPFIQWTVENQSYTLLAPISSTNTGNHGSMRVLARATSAPFALGVSDAWTRCFPGCHTRRWRPDAIFRSRDNISGVIGRDSRTLVVLARDGANKRPLALRLPLLNGRAVADKADSLRTMKSLQTRLAVMTIGDYYANEFYHAVHRVDTLRSLWQDFTFSSRGTYIVSFESNSVPWPGGMIGDLIPVVKAQPELVFSRRGRQRDEPIPLYDDPANESADKLQGPHLTLSDWQYHHLMRAFAHFCFEKTSGRLIFDDLCGQYSADRRLLVLQPPGGALISSKGSVQSGAKVSRRRFARGHECSWACSALELGRMHA